MRSNPQGALCAAQARRDDGWLPGLPLFLRLDFVIDLPSKLPAHLCEPKAPHLTAAAYLRDVFGNEPTDFQEPDVSFEDNLAVMLFQVAG